MSTLEGFHYTRSPRCPQWRGSTVYRTLHQVPKVSTLEGFHCTRSPRCPQWRSSIVYRTLYQVPKVSTIEGFHCIHDTPPGPQGVHNILCKIPSPTSLFLQGILRVGKIPSWPLQSLLPWTTPPHSSVSPPILQPLPPSFIPRPALLLPRPWLRPTTKAAAQEALHHHKRCLMGKSPHPAVVPVQRHRCNDRYPNPLLF